MSAADWQNDSRGELASRRYRELVLELGEEMRNRYGWKAAVARRLGVHASYVSKIVGGAVSTVGADIIDRAAARIGLREEYFLDEAGRSYRDFLHERGPTELGLPSSWDAGMKSSARMWRTLSRRAAAIRQAEEDGDDDLRLRKARDIAQAVFATRLVQAAQAIAATDDPEIAWPHALQIAEQAEAEQQFIEMWERLADIFGTDRG